MIHSLRVVVLVVVAGLSAASCSASENVSPPTASATVAAPTAGLIGPDAFSLRVEDPRVVTINVHVPDEGAIAGTDLTIPFDQIATSSALPAERDTPLAVYCRSGNMSADAVRDLEALGYTDVVELEGGFNAWTKAGRPLEPPASSS
jgi:rhodanese-related sulfurtransferase